MGFTVKEKALGRNRASAGTSREYLVVHDGNGDSDENTAAQALYDWLDPVTGNPGYVNTPGIDQYYELTALNCDELIGIQPVTFEGSVDWKFIISTIAGGKIVPAKPTETNEIMLTYNAQASGGNIKSSKYTNAYSTRFLLNSVVGGKWEGKFPDALATDYYDFAGHINAEKNDKGFKYKGIDLSPPPPTFEINWSVPNSTHTTSFQVDVMRYVGTVNSTPFILFGHSFDRGELFYNGITGTKRTESDWELNYSFSFSRDRRNKTGENPAGPDDRVPIYGGELLMTMFGHNYLWLYDIPAWDPVNKQFSDPGVNAGVYVEQVWDEKDWTTVPSLDTLQSLTLEPPYTPVP